MRWVLLPLLSIATAAPAAERKLFVSSFERVRVSGPYRVIVATGRSPSGSVESADPRQLDRVEVRQEGSTVYVRPATANAEPERRVPLPSLVTVTLASPALAGAYLIGSGALSVAGMKGPRVDLSLAGTGTLEVTGADATTLNATTIGTGRITVAGRTGKVQLLVNGAGGIAAGALDAGELTVRLDGPGEVIARARFTATLANTGLGRITVAGAPKCLVKAGGGGPVTCGAGQAR